MSQVAPPHDPPPKDVYKVRAHEIWGGNNAAQDRISVPGFDAHLYAIPWQGQLGGDLRFVSTCAMGQIVRFTLADIAGHGPEAGEWALRLRSLMRKHINTPNPTKFARALNAEFNRISEAGGFATAIITTYFAPTDHLIACNAGHPRPLLYRARERRWEIFDESAPDVLKPGDARQTGISNLPLGIITPTNYPQFATKLELGDIYISYTDALIEAKSPDGRQLGEQGLMQLVQGLDVTDPARIGPAVLDAIGAHRAGAPSDDDTTLLVLYHNGTNPPDGVWPRVKALGRLVGIIK
jgi:serine phosphatase RsbU (regulator of sigma subunit)